MENEFDFRIVFDEEIESKVLVAKYHEGTFGRCVYNVFSKDGEFLFEAKKKDAEEYVRTGHWAIQTVSYQINKQEDTYVITLHDNESGEKLKDIAICYELKYAEKLIKSLT